MTGAPQGWPLTALLLAACVTTSSSGGGGLGLRRGGPNPWAMDQRLRMPGGVEQFGLERALLVAGGKLRDVDALAAAEDSLRTQLQQVADDAKSQSAPGMPLYLRVHSVMHQRMLQGGYTLDASDLTSVLRERRFNCLTGTATYVLAARKAGLNATAYGMQGHIMALVFDGDGAHQVETTFRDQSRVDRAARAAELGSLVPVELRGSTFDVSPAELVAMMYWNRAATSGKRAAAHGTDDEFMEHQEAMLGYISLGPPRVAARQLQELAAVVRAGLGNECILWGCDLPISLVNAWLSPQRLGTLVRPLLRDLRMELYERWFAAAAPEEKCAVFMQAQRDDGSHPRMVTWMDRPEVRGCSLQ